MHTLQHVLGIDNPTGPIYLFWSGIGGYILALLAGLKGYLSLKKHHKNHIDSLHNHIDQQIAKITDKAND